MFYLPRGIRFSIFTVCPVGNNKTLEKHRAWFHNVDERKCKQMTQILVKNRGWNWLYSVGTLFTNSTFRKSLAAEGGCVGMSCHGPLAELPILLIFIWFLGTVLEEHSASAKVSGANRHLGGGSIQLTTRNIWHHTRLTPSLLKVLPLRQTTLPTLTNKSQVWLSKTY